ERHRITLINTVPSAAPDLVSMGIPASVATVNLSAEILPRVTVERLYQHSGVGQIYNLYGPTENTIFSTFSLIGRKDTGPPVIGKPIANTRVSIVDRFLEPVPIGTPGYLYLAGEGLARCYLSRSDLTSERFVPEPFALRPGARAYRTGDLCRYLRSGNIDFLGRADRQVKLRGFRIELQEIESAIRQHPSIRDTAVIAGTTLTGDRRIVAFLAPNSEGCSISDIREDLRKKLPEYMVPSTFEVLDRLPLNANGKVDHKALLAIAAVDRKVEHSTPGNDIEQRIAAVWGELLESPAVDIDTNFFDLGGHSLLLVRARARLKTIFEAEISLLDMFRYPTVRSFAEFLSKQQIKIPSNNPEAKNGLDAQGLFESKESDVAIVGMSGRFPGARSVKEFWDNLKNGIESISFFSAEQLKEEGIPAAVADDEDYVGARGVVEDAELFDASFFGFTGTDAEMTDPQQRVFLECAWEALEDAGYDPSRNGARIGVYAGASLSSYLVRVRSLGNGGLAMGLMTLIGNDKDHLAPRVSYKLNLKGPSVNVQTACSTSLVAVHLACKALLGGECDMALAGGVSIGAPRRAGYRYEEGGIYSPDGHCRTFDARAMGTVGGEGAGIVVLKRLRDAIGDGDHIRAVIRGSAINNDGSFKAGYTAPSIEGQAQVIEMALTAANVPAATINYVEAHGTATPLGDPIEVAALKQAFGDSPSGSRCALGSVKTNLGHLDAAAGVAGLIKSVLALEHREIPPSLHFEHLNPEIDFDGSPFYINTQLTPWPVSQSPRRAGVSSFGIGGTNAHVILEEAPAPRRINNSRGWQLLLLSARTAQALDRVTSDFLSYLEHNPEIDLSDVAHTLQVGRSAFNHRRMFVSSGNQDAIDALRNQDANRVVTTTCEGHVPSVVFMFPGQGAQYSNMGAELYQQEPEFKQSFDTCADLSRSYLGADLRSVVFKGAAESNGANGLDSPDGRIDRTIFTQSALFALEYSLARLWMSWGVKPRAMIGHSIGEYVAACLAGVFSLESALEIVAARGALMEGAQPGLMMMAPIPAVDLRGLAGARPVSIAAINGPSMTVVSGAVEPMAEFEEFLTQHGVNCHRLRTDRAFHSDILGPTATEFRHRISDIRLQQPSLPFISNITGRWITDSDATDPAYWAAHMTSPVLFDGGIKTIINDLNRCVFLEVGPGKTLGGMVRQSASGQAPFAVLNSMRSAREQRSDTEVLLEALGGLWQKGVEIDWAGFQRGRRPM
ncbi:MAG TPA: beta-ketoacyl synthase N-terminal-like domain-containing protein, partial [Blastocatellia bacterium]|nr:beta-ketoacyl synthase N-terminal-like domain-containing protein [Blastocatellia bacterium]